MILSGANPATRARARPHPAPTRPTLGPTPSLTHRGPAHIPRQLRISISSRPRDISITVIGSPHGQGLSFLTPFPSPLLYDPPFSFPDHSLLQTNPSSRPDPCNLLAFALFGSSRPSPIFSQHSFSWPPFEPIWTQFRAILSQFRAIAMWTIVHPLVTQCYHAVGMARARLLGSGAAVVASHCALRATVAVPLVYMPLKDYEVVGLQQLS